ncbi:hypothetical protein SAMN05421810_1072 [Amycolatopsis arida]|uniref:Uncharacterized protein n=1 Tax=Amycolatopsis arida TaxID=587909 RepID=A0A1I5Y8D4_9PSEU|nr:hypothetical protein [Amycolatopsis arida]TDX90358.1 hypothetical protein CLV69_1072 [Amycolatopsis arida]SFQ40502.1 hypothetical protein SAMN05421810_1072 [Amycolatopsis arida]
MTLEGPVQLFVVIALVSLPTVMYGGYALLSLLHRGKLTDRQRAYFRAGHAHAGVLLVLALATLAFVSASGLGEAARWVVCVLLLVGILAQSGGFFLNLAPGRAGRWSVGNTVTVVGAVLLAAAMLTTAYGVAVA